jgi:glycosyltransferase involved in cell wall biosynthesis
MKLSVVVPLYNEEENVAELHRRIAAALADSGHEVEMLFVDDGSRDGTVAILRRIATTDPRVRVLQLRRNFGQTPSMRAGIDHATGEVIVTMDGDLQNDPKDIPAMVAMMAEGYDLVAGWRRNRKDAWLSRKLPSRIANWMIGKVTGIAIRDNGCSLKVYRSDVIKRTALYSEMHRFIPAMVSGSGGRIAEVAVSHHPRLYGKSKYGISRTGKVLLDMITVKMLVAFSQHPLHWFALLAAPCALLSLAALVLHFIPILRGAPVSGVVLPAVAVLAGYLAAHMVILGFLGELVVRTGKPHVFRSLSLFR